MILKALERTVAGLARRPSIPAGASRNDCFEMECRSGKDCPLDCPMTGFEQGAAFEITGLDLCETQAKRLRELGVREGARCCMVMNNGKLIVCVHDCRIALRHEVGACIRARRLAA